MRFRFIPWKWIIRKMALGHGFFDPFTLFAKAESFGQPAEIKAPVELLRLAAVLHARGFINSQVLQQNQDWIWPYWIERQFKPLDEAFIPRAFALSYINLTHRNWTAVGELDGELMPIVDPRGLITPFWDSWSLDICIKNKEDILVPSKSKKFEQTLLVEDQLAVLSRCQNERTSFESKVAVSRDLGGENLDLIVKAQADEASQLLFLLRPYNPEGISFIEKIELFPGELLINGKERVLYPTEEVTLHFSDYQGGDVVHHLQQPEPSQKKFKCDVGMVTAAISYPLIPKRSKEIKLTIPLKKTLLKRQESSPHLSWSEVQRQMPELRIPNKKWEYLFQTSLKSLLLLTPNGTVYPGPYTYKKFWFRDAVFICYALLSVGQGERAARIIENFPKQQKLNGYFHSQEGEWDSNGQVIFLYSHYLAITDQTPSEKWLSCIQKAADWILHKIDDTPSDPRMKGLLPAGFSAEHFGPNDHYFWDDFWAVSGLRHASLIFQKVKREDLATKYQSAADLLLKNIEESLEEIRGDFDSPIMPASPLRRMDSGAIGSLVCAYPLQIISSTDERVKNTIEFLLDTYKIKNTYYHEMSHSGINAYLTLHLAQCLLQANDPRCLDLMEGIANLASPTGQWPEAIHPQTEGGCMGDGQHAWASAEWTLMIRNLFVREEKGQLLLFTGVTLEWLERGEEVRFGPTQTSFGQIAVSLKRENEQLHFHWDAKWTYEAPPIRVGMLGKKTVAMKQPGILKLKDL